MCIFNETEQSAVICDRERKDVYTLCWTSHGEIPKVYGSQCERFHHYVPYLCRLHMAGFDLLGKWMHTFWSLYWEALRLLDQKWPHSLGQDWWDLCEWKQEFHKQGWICVNNSSHKHRCGKSWPNAIPVQSPKRRTGVRICVSAASPLWLVCRVFTFSNYWIKFNWFNNSLPLHPIWFVVHVGDTHWWCLRQVSTLHYEVLTVDDINWKVLYKFNVVFGNHGIGASFQKNFLTACPILT